MYKQNSIFEAAAKVLQGEDSIIESAAMDRLAQARLEMKKGKETEPKYLALINSISKTIPWTKKPTKSRTSALVQYTGEIGVNQVTFTWHDISKYSYMYTFHGVLISTVGKYGRIEDFGPVVDILAYDGMNDEHTKKNLEDFQKAIDLAKKIDPKKAVVKEK